MTANETIKKGWTREDFLALLERGRQIKARRQKEAEEWYAERQRRKKEAFIVQRSNPHLEEIISLFDSEITMFNDMK